MRFSLLAGFIIYCLGISGQPIKLNQIVKLPAQLSESSGLVRDPSGIFWSHNDSDNDPVLLGFNLEGHIIQTIEITNSPNIDWEDLSLVNDTFIICDCGNNLNTRNNLKILKVPMGSLIPGSNFREAEIINFSCLEQTAFPPKPQQLHFDLEAMACTADSIYLFSKNRTQPCDGLTYQYVMPNRVGNYPLLERQGYFYSGVTKFADWVTGAALNARGDLALLTASKIILFHNFKKKPRIQGQAEIFKYNGNSQLEAIYWNDTCSLWITDEDNVTIANDNNLYSLSLCNEGGISLGSLISDPPCSEVKVVDSLVIPISNRTRSLSYQIINTNGTVIQDGIALPNQHSIDVRNLPSGQYRLIGIDSSKPLIYCIFSVTR